MSNAQDPAHSGHDRIGQHLLGPHVIGQRVVVRRLVRGETGPSGGPALTDVLGVCLSWSDGTCVVQPREGAPVAVEISDIVSGKPVPPRPSVRLRASTAECESHTASLFPGVETTPRGAWSIRWEPVIEGRPRKRANSCLAIDDPGMPVADALEHVIAFYTDRDRPALVQVEVGSTVAQQVAAAGWEPVPDGDADFLVTSAAMLRRALPGTPFQEGDVFALTEETGRARVSLSDGGAEWAHAQAAIDGDWLGIHDVYVDPQHRRQGLATQLMSELLDWGAAQGARTVWLHVETDNVPALALYEGLGFTRHHTCRYVTPRPD